MAEKLQDGFDVFQKCEVVIGRFQFEPDVYYAMVNCCIWAIELLRPLSEAVVDMRWGPAVRRRRVAFRPRCFVGILGGRVFRRTYVRRSSAHSWIRRK